MVWAWNHIWRQWRGTENIHSSLSTSAETRSQTVYFNKDRRLKDDSLTPHVGKNTKYIKLSCTLRQNASQSLQLSKESSWAQVGMFTGEGWWKGRFSASGDLQINTWRPVQAWTAQLQGSGLSSVWSSVGETKGLGYMGSDGLSAFLGSSAGTLFMHWYKQEAFIFISRIFFVFESARENVSWLERCSLLKEHHTRSVSQSWFSFPRKMMQRISHFYYSIFYLIKKKIFRGVATSDCKSPNQSSLVSAALLLKRSSPPIGSAAEHEGLQLFS